MSGAHDDMDDIVQSFVHTDLASLDRIGGEPESFTLSPHLTEKSPSLHQQSPPQPAGSSFAASRAAREGPELTPASATAAPPARAPHELPHTPEEPDAAAAAPAQSSAAQSSAAQSQSESQRAPAASSQPGSRRSSVRNVSTSSTASVSTQEREKRASLGDKFKMFGKRITSGSKK